jgi:hypothetical protein
MMQDMFKQESSTVGTEAGHNWEVCMGADLKISMESSSLSKMVVLSVRNAMRHPGLDLRRAVVNRMSGLWLSMSGFSPGAT